MEQTDHEGIARALSEHPAKKGVVFNIAVTVLEIGGGIGLFHLATGIGGSDVEAYLAGSIAPLLGALVVWVRSRKFSGASAAMFTFVVLSAVVAVVVGRTDPKALLYKDCAITALIGLVFGLSCLLMPRPVVFYLAQRYGTDGAREGMAAFDKMWVAYQEFRRGIFQISIIWATIYLIQAGGTALIIASTTFSTAYNWNQILPITAFVVAMARTAIIARHGQRIGRQAAADAAGDQENRST
ncbi:MAG: VC0807 family protein [Antricoccus sp.]